ncbi:MAG: DUF4349 domain-containing protein [Pyrinomonadaceae bacterium]
MMRTTGFLTLLFLFSLSTIGCGETAATNKSVNSSQSVSLSEIADQAAVSATTANTAVSAQKHARGSSKILEDKSTIVQARYASIDTAPTDRKIVRNAEIGLESETPEDAQRRITAIAERNGGFVADSQQSSSNVQSNKRDTVSMSIRIPSEKFAATLDEIRQESGQIIFESIKGDDVTEEFIDVEARLKAKKALEQQFVEIMKRAGNVEDALNVQSQLADVRGEIEKIEGRKRFLENQTSLSTIKIKLQTPAVFAAKNVSFSHRFGESFATGFDFAMNFVLGFVTLLIAVLPFAVIVLLPIFVIVRYIWKRQNRPRSVVDIAKEELNAA